MISNGPLQLIVGIGSPHGDDQIGWMVVEALRPDCDDGIAVHTASVPLDLLDWLDNVHSLHVVDACVAGKAVGELTRWNWPELIDYNNTEPPFQGTHGFDLVSTLRLAEKLGRLPQQVVVWGIEVGSCDVLKTSEGDIEEFVPSIARQILQELTHAREIAGAVASDSG